MAFFVTTTAYDSNTIVIPDLDNWTFIHPIVNYDLELNFTLAQISASEDLGSLIDNNYVSCIYQNIDITSSIMLKVIDLNSLAQLSTYTGLLRVENNIILGGGGVGDGGQLKEGTSSTAQLLKSEAAMSIEIPFARH